MSAGICEGDWEGGSVLFSVSTRVASVALAHSVVLGVCCSARGAEVAADDEFAEAGAVGVEAAEPGVTADLLP